MKKTNWKKLGFEFLSIFIAVTSAFALNNWNEKDSSLRLEETVVFMLDIFD